MWEKIKTAYGRIPANVRAQIYSFVKTYFTVFLAFYLRDIIGETQEGNDLMLLNWAVIVPAAKWSLLSGLRNIYKAMTE